jgi:hypothetical protein
MATAMSDEIVGGIPAYGTLIQVLSDPGPPEVYTTIEGVGDITGPGNSMDEIDVTSHSTGVPIKQVIPGLIDLGELAFPCFWNPEDPTQKMSSPYGMEYLFFTRKVTKFQLVNTNPTHRTRQFKGFVKSIAENAKVTGVMERQCAVRITSPFVDVASPVSLTPSSVSAPAAGSPSGTIDVKTGGSNAPWNAVPSAPWITITAPTAPQMGDGEITYSVAAQLPAAPARTGTIDVTGLGLTFTIDQAVGT